MYSTSRRFTSLWDKVGIVPLKDNSNFISRVLYTVYSNIY